MDSKQGFNACLRCKARKIKCDREMPKCSNCEKAGTPCLTTDAATGRQVPRSYLRHLEHRVHQLEHELELMQRCLSIGSAYRFVPEAVLPYMSQWPILSISSQIMGAYRDRYPQPVDPLVVDSGAGEEPSSNINSTNNISDDSAAAGTTNTSSGNISGNGSPYTLPADLPTKRNAEHMVRLYFEHLNAIFPVLHREQFIQTCFEPVYGYISPGVQLCSKFTNLNLRHSSTEPGTGTFYRRWIDCGNSLSAAPDPQIHSSLFFLFVVFALGKVAESQGSPDTNSLDQAAQYFSAALTYFPAVARGCMSGRELAGLQAVLLIALYGIARPSSANAWYSVGDAMRMCIDMGLHTESKGAGESFEQPEPSKSTLTDPFVVDTRRRLFWVTYLMERSVCVSLERPTCLPDAVVDCKLPSMVDDSWQNFANSVEGSPKEKPHNQFEPPDHPSYKWVFAGFLSLRKIQYRILEELYLCVEVKDAGFQRARRDELAAELEKWHDTTLWDKTVFNFEWDTDLFEVAYLYSRVMLYRNSRMIPEPNMEESRLLLDAGIKMLRLWIKIGNADYRISPWPLVHDSLQTAVACLHALYQTNALNHSFELKPFEEVIDRVLEMMQKYSALSTQTAQMHCDFLREMMRKTIDYLQSPENNKRKRSPSSSPDTMHDLPQPVEPQGGEPQKLEHKLEHKIEPQAESAHPQPSQSQPPPPPPPHPQSSMQSQPSPQVQPVQQPQTLSQMPPYMPPHMPPHMQPVMAGDQMAFMPNHMHPPGPPPPGPGGPQPQPQFQPTHMPHGAPPIPNYYYPYQTYMPPPVHSLGGILNDPSMQRCGPPHRHPFRRHHRGPPRPHSPHSPRSPHHHHHHRRCHSPPPPPMPPCCYYEVPPPQPYCPEYHTPPPPPPPPPPPSAPHTHPHPPGFHGMQLPPLNNLMPHQAPK